MIRRNAVLRDEPFQDVQALARDHVYPPISQVARAQVGRALDQVCVHEMLSYSPRHLARHCERRCRRRRDDPRRVLWVDGPVRLRELQTRQVRACLVPACQFNSRDVKLTS